MPAPLDLMLTAGPSNVGATVDGEMLKTWISRGATVAPAGFAIFTWYQRQADAKEHERREALQTVAIALRDVCREAFAMRYRGPNTMEITQRHLGLVIRAVEEPLPATMAVASAKDAHEIERLEQAAFDELGTLLSQWSPRRSILPKQRRARLRPEN